MGYGPIKHFTDIEAWKLARELKIAVYSLIKKLPADENVEPDAEIEQKGTLCKSLG